jgi:nucleotide sugar dehydrogenase
VVDRATHNWSELNERFRARDAVVAVIGLGYVGLPVALSFAKAGFKVLGVDQDAVRISSLTAGRSYIADISDEELDEVTASGRFSASTDYGELSRADAVLISVPTPLTQGIPDLSAINGAGASLAEVMSGGTLVVLESTTYPGTTEEILRPLLEVGGLVAGEDFLLAFSPERIDPGNPQYGFTDIPKIVGGIDAVSTAAAEALYGAVVPKVVPVTSTREAEMAKLIENTYRHVNIALVNELAVYAHEWGVDIWEAIEAAATKPFGYTPFWPGPGWGGHCIPLDPSYLSWKVRRDNAHELRFVELAQTVNAEMPQRVIDRVSWLLNESGKAIKGSRILGVGVAYKGGTDDTRGSAGAKILNKLAERGAKVNYHDPLVPSLDIGDVTTTSSSLHPDFLDAQDLAIVFVPQQDVDWDALEKHCELTLDCCNAFGRKSERIVRL